MPQLVLRQQVLGSWASITVKHFYPPAPSGQVFFRYFKMVIQVSYILTGNSNPLFNLRSLINSPMLQSDLVLKVDSEGKVDMTLRYVGVAVRDSSNYIEPSSADVATTHITHAMEKIPGTVQQVAQFEVIESLNTELAIRGDYFYVPLTETNLEHALFAFVPKVIVPDKVQGPLDE